MDIMAIDSRWYQRVFRTMHDGVYFVDTERKITFWNQSAELMSGFTADEVVGSCCADNILTHVDADGVSLCREMCPLAATMEDGCSREAQIYLHHKDGHRVPVSVRTSPVIDSSGNVTGGVEVFTDISSKDAHTLRVKELQRLGLLDELTQLASRPSMLREIAARLDENPCCEVPFGVLFADIDQFKKFNETHGRRLGDKVLRFVAKTMIAISRPFDVYGRWEGDKFLAIVRNVTPEEMVHLGEHLRSLIQASYLMHRGEQISVTVSIGGTMVRHDDTVESLVKRAEALIRESKIAGRNRLTMDFEMVELMIELARGINLGSELE